MVERAGETLTLSDEGKKVRERDLPSVLKLPTRVERMLSVCNKLRISATGDDLERATAAALLKLGVARVHRGVHLSPVSEDPNLRFASHTELDLLFNYGGRLWVVDCKDRIPSEDLAERLRQSVSRILRGIEIPKSVVELLGRVKSELKLSQTKVLKEDLLAAREVGGLLGQVICVRKSELGRDVRQFGNQQGIELVKADQLWEGLRGVMR